MNGSDIKIGSFTGWCYHQAGHLVAAALRDGDEAVGLPVAELLPRDCVPEAGRPFVAFAGPWSERECGVADVEIVTGEGAFDPVSASARCADRDVVDEANIAVAGLLARAGGGADRAWGWVPGVTAAWAGELRQHWAVIDWAAGTLQEDFELSVGQVRNRLRAEEARRRRPPAHRR